MTNGHKRPIGIAIIGCGYWGVNYIRIFSELPEARVAVVCDQRADQLREVSRRFPFVRVTTSVDEALQVDGVDAAIICTQARHHFSVGGQCLLAGKHILIEKPIAATTDEADRLIALAESRGLVLMVGHTFLFNPALRRVKEYVDRADLGRVYYLYARRTNLGPFRHDVNAVWDLAPHDISIFNFLLGDVPTWVSAVGARVLRNGREDVGFVALGYRDGVIGHVHVSWADPHKVREVVVVGSDKRIVFNDLDPMEQVRVFEKGVALADGADQTGEYPFQLRDGAIISPHIEASEPLKNQCQHFLSRIVHGGPPLSSGPEGRDVVRVLEAIDRSMAHHGSPVTVGEEDRLGDVALDAAGAIH